MGWHATQTLKSPERWLERVERDGCGLEIIQPIGTSERAIEQLLTGLRLREGLVLTPALKSQLAMDRITFYEAQGLLEREGNRLRASTQGWLVLNRLLNELLA